MRGLIADLLFALFPLRYVQAHADAPDDFSRGSAQGLEVDIQYAVFPFVLESYGLAPQCGIVMRHGQRVGALASQVFEYRTANDFVVMRLVAAKAASPV